MVKYCMWKRIVNFWNEWTETYNDLFSGNLIYLSSYDGNIVWVLDMEEDSDQSRSVQSENQ
jgi:hypothetical protein